MDPSALPQQTPYIGAGLILMYLVGTLVADRIALRRDARNSATEWAKEREEMRAQCRREIAAAIADYDRQAEFQRNRITRLETENAALRAHQQSGH
jgi:C4-dicarboxylate-specific signal transduction histidine kinase